MVERVKPASILGGELETRVLEVLFDLKKASAREVYERVGIPANLAYTTIGTVLDRLHGKGLVRRELNGRAFVYEPAVDREALDRARADNLLHRFFGEEHKPAIAALVDALESYDPELLEELSRRVAARRKKRNS